MSTSLLKEQAAKAAAKVAHMAETTKKFPPFRMDLPKRIHVPKHVKSADLSVPSLLLLPAVLPRGQSGSKHVTA